eukprot:7073017-Pyramimonas_sp.AAC.2
MRGACGRSHWVRRWVPLFGDTERCAGWRLAHAGGAAKAVCRAPHGPRDLVLGGAWRMRVVPLGPSVGLSIGSRIVALVGA